MSAQALAESRPSSVPAVGVVPAFDAGWVAHAANLDRETVEVLTPLTSRGWALLGWDVRASLGVADDEG